MSTEQTAALLAMMKIDLGVTATAYDDRFIQYIEAAIMSIEDEGVTLDLDSPQDAQIVVMYACWSWRRRDSGEGMPRMLRYALNNRIFHEKMGGESDG